MHDHNLGASEAIRWTFTSLISARPGLCGGYHAKGYPYRDLIDPWPGRQMPNCAWVQHFTLRQRYVMSKYAIEPKQPASRKTPSAGRRGLTRYAHTIPTLNPTTAPMSGWLCRKAYLIIENGRKYAASLAKTTGVGSLSEGCACWNRRRIRVCRSPWGCRSLACIRCIALKP